jgi:hypothetical protein
MPLFNQRATNAPTSDDELAYVPPPGSANRTPATRNAPTASREDSLLADLLRSATPTTRGAVAVPNPPVAPRRTRRLGRPLREERPPVAGRPLAPPVVVTVYGLAWWQRMALEAMSYVFAWVLWSINAMFTILGLISLILPPTALGVVLGMLIHLFISWGEQYYPRQRGGIKVLGWTMGIFDIGTNVYGLAASVAFLRPQLLGGLPTNPLEWFLPFMGSFANGLGLRTEPSPQWILQAFLLIFLATIVALTPEFLVKYFRARMSAVWHQRHFDDAQPR